MPSPDSAHSGRACASHRLRSRGAGLVRAEELCAARSRLPTAAASARPPSRACQPRATSPGLRNKPRAPGWRPEGPALSLYPATDTSFPSGRSAPPQLHGAPSLGSVCMRASGPRWPWGPGNEGDPAPPSRGSQAAEDTDEDQVVKVQCDEVRVKGSPGRRDWTHTGSQGGLHGGSGP